MLLRGHAITSCQILRHISFFKASTQSVAFQSSHAAFVIRVVNFARYIFNARCKVRAPLWWKHSMLFWYPSQVECVQTMQPYGIINIFSAHDANLGKCFLFGSQTTDAQS